jgi:hypothetical protein
LRNEPFSFFGGAFLILYERILRIAINGSALCIFIEVRLVFHLESKESERLEQGLLTLNGWFPGTTIQVLLLSVNHLPEHAMNLAAATAFVRLCPLRTVLIGPGIHLPQLTRRHYSMAARPIT